MKFEFHAVAVRTIVAHSPIGQSGKAPAFRLPSPGSAAKGVTK